MQYKLFIDIESKIKLTTLGEREREIAFYGRNGKVLHFEENEIKSKIVFGTWQRILWDFYV